MKMFTRINENRTLFVTIQMKKGSWARHVMKAKGILTTVFKCEVERERRRGRKKLITFKEGGGKELRKWSRQ